MVLSMPRPSPHPKTGVYRARKAVPAELRAIVGKRELIETLGTKDPAEAKRRHPEVLERFEAILGAARARLTGQSRRPTPKEIATMAGEVYREAVAFAEQDPGTVEAREAGLDLLRAEMEDGPTPRRLREAEAILLERGLAADAETVERMARAIVDARGRAEDVAKRRAAGDWSSDLYGALFPPPAETLAPVASVPDAPPSLTLTALLDAYDRENPRPQKTMDKRRAAARLLQDAAGHEDARRIGKADVRALKDRRLASKRTLVTVNDDIAALRPIWKWGAANGHLPDGSNPFAGMGVRVQRRGLPPRGPFSADEAKTILTAARNETGFLRWLPWVLALTGCRLEEACGADKEDVRRVHGVWCLAIHADREGRELKNEQAQRMVPLHSALIAEGFLAYALGLSDGSPLFPDLAVGSYGRRGSTATKRHGRWVRGLGITDPRKAPAHAWRHWMKDALRFAAVPAEAADAILGHNNPTNAGSGYGTGWRGRPDRLAVEVAKVKSPLSGSGEEPEDGRRRRRRRRGREEAPAPVADQ